MIPYIIVVVLNVIVMLDVIKFDNEDTLKGVIIGLFGAAFGLCLITFVVSSLYRSALFRVILCCGIKG